MLCRVGPLLTRASRQGVRTYDHTRLRILSRTKTYFGRDGQNQGQAQSDRYDSLAYDRVVLRDGDRVRKSSRFLYTTLPIIAAVIAVAYLSGWVSVSITSDQVRNLHQQLEERSTRARRSYMDNQEDEKELTREELLSCLQEVEKAVLQSELKALESEREAVEATRELQHARSMSHAFALRLHGTFFRLLCNNEIRSAFLDDALLASNPIVLTDGTELDTSNVALVRVLDPTGKTSMIIVGVDTQAIPEGRGDPRDWHEETYGLYEWIRDLTRNLTRKSGYISEDGLQVMLYTRERVVEWDSKKEVILANYVKLKYFPQGFPVKQMRTIDTKLDAHSNIGNAQESNSLIQGAAQISKRGQASAGKVSGASEVEKD